MTAAALAAIGVFGVDVLGAPDSASAMPARTPQCRLDDLTAELTQPNTPPGQPTQLRVIWINRSDHACTLTGFGGADVVDATGQRHSVPRSGPGSTPAHPTPAQPAAPIELSPGMRAHSTITYTAQGGTGTFTPVTLVATAPDETRSVSLPWTGGPLPTFPDHAAPEISLDPVQPNVS